MAPSTQRLATAPMSRPSRSEPESTLLLLGLLPLSLMITTPPPPLPLEPPPVFVVVVLVVALLALGAAPCVSDAVLVRVGDAEGISGSVAVIEPVTLVDGARE